MSNKIDYRELQLSLNTIAREIKERYGAEVFYLYDTYEDGYHFKVTKNQQSSITMIEVYYILSHRPIEIAKKLITAHILQTMVDTKRQK